MKKLNSEFQLLDSLFPYSISVDFKFQNDWIWEFAFLDLVSRFQKKISSGFRTRIAFKYMGRLEEVRFKNVFSKNGTFSFQQKLT